MFDLTTIEGLADKPPEVRRVNTLVGPAFVRSLSSLERDRWESWFVEQPEKGLFSASLAAICLCDDKGVPLFEDFAAGAKTLGRLGARMINPIYSVAAELAGVTRSDEDSLGESLGNDGPSGGDSSFGSLSRSDTATPTTCSED